MPWKKVPCPVCGKPKSRHAKTCRACSVPYERTPEHCQHLSDALTGKPKPWLQGRKRPDVGKKIRGWWTPERREAKRQEMLLLNPDARYHGLSCKGARRLRDAITHCEKCGHDGSESRLDIHHRNGDKKNQSLANLTVLCHRCHMAVHAKQGETGWHSYWKKRKTIPSSTKPSRPSSAPAAPRGISGPGAPRKARGSAPSPRSPAKPRSGGRIGPSFSQSSPPNLRRNIPWSRLLFAYQGPRFRAPGHNPRYSTHAHTRPRHTPPAQARNPSNPSTEGWSRSTARSHRVDPPAPPARRRR